MNRKRLCNENHFLRRAPMYALRYGSIRRMDCLLTIMISLWSEAMSSVCFCSWISCQHCHSRSLRHNNGLHENALYQMSSQRRLKHKIPWYNMDGSWVDQCWWLHLERAVVRGITHRLCALLYTTLYIHYTIIHRVNQILLYNKLLYPRISPRCSRQIDSQFQRWY